MTRRIPLGSSFGVMQGRLSRQSTRGYQAFPLSTWPSEFALASDRNLEHIEWIVDRHAMWDNPLLNHPEAVKDQIESTRVAVVSVCADVFMDYPLDENDSESFALFSAILSAMKGIKATHIVIPCVDQSSLHDVGNLDRLKCALPRMVAMAEDFEVIIALEADLSPPHFADLLMENPSANISVNYDSGNSASLGYSWATEKHLYGSRISLVHLKDRERGGPSVPLGTGAAELKDLLHWLEQGFDGPVTMQCFRDFEGLDVLDEQIEWISKSVGNAT